MADPAPALRGECLPGGVGWRYGALRDRGAQADKRVLYANRGNALHFLNDEEFDDEDDTCDVGRYALGVFFGFGEVEVAVVE